ncbi:MAG: 50S ribosomal protein L29 [Candidatus Pelagibacter sp.]|jgi:large subunit ribosomal protein L29|nr:50S ribosomal protein L29 [Candidatus Pelagibacter sp.]|tara:strand:+ start:5050 stop:5232 length:183 start_codon:yes stop_codon:yes gene_type:complete
MKLKEINKLTKDQLHKNLEKFKKDLFNLRFRKINGQLTNPSKFRETKKTIARISTLINKK